MHERAPVSQDTSLDTLTTKPSNSPHRIEPVSSTCVPEGETGKSTCKLCLFFHTCSLSSGPLFSSTLLQQLALRGKQLDAGCPWKILESRQRKWSRYVCFHLFIVFLRISLSVKYSTALYFFIYPVHFYPFLLVPSEAR